MSSGRIVVTGASGFIGSALVKRLVADHKDVTATARRQTEALSKELGAPVSKLEVMGELPDFDGVETIVHCATPNDIQSKAEDGGLALAVMGTRRLLEKAARQGVRRVVYLSTLQVYGTELEGKIDETSPVCCESLYGLNHYLGEEVCRYFVHTSGLDIVALRPSNVYGVPGVSTVNRETLVPMCFVREAVETGAVCLRSSGKQMRNFVSTDEVAEIIMQLLKEFPSGFTVVNAVSEWEARIRDIAELTGEVWQKVKKVPLDIQVLSDKPENPATFTVTSRHIPPQRSQEASRQQMAEVIKRLIQANPQSK